MTNYNFVLLQGDHLTGPSLLPNSRQVLVPANQLCFNDASWLAGKDEALVHPDISDVDADCLGVLSLRAKNQVCLPARVSTLRCCILCVEHHCVEFVCRC